MFNFNIVCVKALKQMYSGLKWEYYMSFSFDSDWLVFHPQSAQDCGWSANTEGYYKVQTKIHSNVVNVPLYSPFDVFINFIQLHVYMLIVAT